MKRLLPKVADNNYYGLKVAYYFFIFFMVINTIRSFIHLLAEDAGLNSIANIIVFEGTPDPNEAIYLFAAPGVGLLKKIHSDSLFGSLPIEISVV